METVWMQLYKVGGRAFLKIGEESLDIKDYELSCTARGGTELKITIGLDDSVMEFSTSATREAYRLLNSTTTNEKGE